MTGTRKYKRRTFQQVAVAAYAQGFAEGSACAKEIAAEELENMTTANTGLACSVLALETKLANMSLLQLAGTRITGLFRGGRHDL